MDIDVWKFAAGLMLFLLAMSLVENAIQGLAGRKFRDLIARNTRTPVRGILTGTIATAILQSSSMVSLMMLAFVGARVMTLRNALLVVFGANLGTTATGWIVATIGFKFNLEVLALPLIALGGLASTMVQYRRLTDIGRLVLGIGVLLLALQFMKGALEGINTWADPLVLANFSSIEYLLFGAVFSALVQSSSATMVIALSMLDSGLINLGSAAALMIGADLGTTSTVILGAMGGSANKKRVALGHFLFNLVTDLVAFVLRAPLLLMLTFVQDPLLALAAFHSAFNVLGLLIWTPLIGRFADFLQHRFRDTDGRVSIYLEETAQAMPEAAVRVLKQEIGHLVDRVVAQNAQVFRVGDEFVESDAASEDNFLRAYRACKTLEGEILAYALDLDRASLSDEETETIAALLQASRDALVSSKQIKDVLDDFAALSADSRVLYDLLKETQSLFYRRLLEMTDDPAAMPLTQVEELAAVVEEGHARCHEQIYADIKNDILVESGVSSILNVNRSFYSSNRAILASIGALAEQQALSEHDLLVSDLKA